jgi:hypothetical protein
MQKPSGDCPAFDEFDDFDWVNAWAEQRPCVPHATPDLSCVPSPPPELLAADIDAIALVRDVLCARDLADARESQKETPKPAPVSIFRLRRTAESVPVVLGSVLGVMMLVVFTAAATFMKLGR